MEHCGPLEFAFRPKKNSLETKEESNECEMSENFIKRQAISADCEADTNIARREATEASKHILSFERKNLPKNDFHGDYWVPVCFE